MKNLNLILHSSLFLGKDYIFLSEPGTFLLCNNLYLYSLSQLDFVRNKKAESGSSFLFSLRYHSSFRYLYPVKGEFLFSSLTQSVRFKNLKLFFRHTQSYLPITILRVYPGGILIYSFGTLSFMPRFSLYCYWFFLSRFLKRLLETSRKVKRLVWGRVKKKISGRIKNLEFRRSIFFPTQYFSHFRFPYFSLFSLYEGTSLRYQDFFSSFAYSRVLSSRLREEVEALHRKNFHPNLSFLEFLFRKGILNLKELALLVQLKLSEASDYRLVLKYTKLKLFFKRTRKFSRVRNRLK